MFGASGLRLNVPGRLPATARAQLILLGSAVSAVPFIQQS